MNTIGKKLINLRKSLNYTLDDVSLKLGSNKQLIDRWEKDLEKPDSYYLKRLAMIYHVDVEFLEQNNTVNTTGSIHQEDKQTDVNKTVNTPLFSLSDKKPKVSQEHSNQHQGHHHAHNHQHKHNEQHGQNEQHYDQFYSGKQNSNYILKLLYKSKKITNTEEAIKLRKTLLIVGITMISVALVIFFVGMVTFLTNMFNFSFNMVTVILGMMSLPFSFFIGITGAYITYAGLIIVVAGYGTQFLDNRKKCPKCQNEVSENEAFCNKCGYDLVVNPDMSCKSCGNHYDEDDIYCKKCGKLLDKEQKE